MSRQPSVDDLPTAPWPRDSPIPRSWSPGSTRYSSLTPASSSAGRDDPTGRPLSKLDFLSRRNCLAETERLKYSHSQLPAEALASSHSLAEAKIV